MIVDVKDLNSQDLEYLRNLIEVQQRFAQLEISRQQLQQQHLQSPGRYYDVWAVDLIAPNGEKWSETIWRGVTSRQPEWP